MELFDSDRLKDFDGFSCGDGRERPPYWGRELDRYLPEHAASDYDDRLTTTYLIYDDDDGAVGFVALSCTQIDITALQQLEEVRYPFVPALLLGQLAVSYPLQRARYGEAIMNWVRRFAEQMPTGCRCIALQVQRDNRKAIRFYSRLGFEKLEADNPEVPARIMVLNLGERSR